MFYSYTNEIKNIVPSMRCCTGFYTNLIGGKIVEHSIPPSDEWIIFWKKGFLGLFTKNSIALACIFVCDSSRFCSNSKSMSLNWNWTLSTIFANIVVSRKSFQVCFYTCEKIFRSFKYDNILLFLKMNIKGGFFHLSIIILFY